MYERTLRRSQTISPFGVGSIISISGESFMPVGVEHWKGKTTTIRLDRLSKFLEVDQFRAAPVDTNAGRINNPDTGVPVVRFPKWLHCPGCRSMILWTNIDENNLGREVPTCKPCNENKNYSSRLVPMRWICICPHGHTKDVPWRVWAHSRSNQSNNRSQKQCRANNLSFLTSKANSGELSDMRIKCTSCNAERNLEGISSEKSMTGIGERCDGKQPWQRQNNTNTESCDENLVVVVAGAGNVYFPKVKSAIDIPPESDFSNRNEIEAAIRATRQFDMINNLEGIEDVVETLKSQIVKILTDNGFDERETITVLADIRNASHSQNSTSQKTSEDEIMMDEWYQLSKNRSNQEPRSTFITKHHNLSETSNLQQVASKLNKLTSVIKLREVRALTGFTRYEDVEDNLVSANGLLSIGKFLPAVEVFGEGIFFNIDENKLKTWESQPDVIQRAETLEERRTDSFHVNRLPSVSPRFLLLHTFSHVLIRQLSFDCGYGSASLRERIYSYNSEAGTSMAGILIYTADGDSEGTLGGLARQGEPQNFLDSVYAALLESYWCSNDPVCSESLGQGVDSLNLSACHACALVSETSCTYANNLLDRNMTTGKLKTSEGFFSDLLLTEKDR